MEEEDKKDVTEETKDEETEDIKKDEELTVCPGDAGETEAVIPVDVGDPKDEDTEAEPEPKEGCDTPVVKEAPDKAKVAKLKAGIENSIKRGVRSGQSRDLAKSLAHIEARGKAMKLLGYIPKGFWADKD